MTTLAEEKFEQQKWAARLRRPMPLFDELLENEFQVPAQHEARTANALGTMLSFASREVPYYREALSRANAGEMDRDPMSVLAALPVLTKLDVQDNNSALLAENLPQGETSRIWMRSSGTTGRPTPVLHTKRSRKIFRFLKQREHRWFRLDPSGSFAAMRLPTHLPRHDDGGLFARGEAASAPTWPVIGRYFSTGPCAFISVDTPAEERIDWLRRVRPDYLMAYSETLELLGFVTGDERPVESLKAVVAISEQLTQSMRDYVERSFGTPVHQNYGLNEIGLVAARCEAGRYHVHSEHCIIEIVDEDGHACLPGKTVRIVVTSLANAAMPLLRYDTGDLAQAVAGECSCNRTLPSFGEIVGRYSLAAYLPDGTTNTVHALREAIENMPTDLMHGFREFQIHQFRDRSMELRMVTRAPMPEGFYTRLQEVWAKATTDSESKLTFCNVEEIARSPGGKHNVFTSEFMPTPDRNSPD